jgi:hypothetical protein
MTNEKFCCKEMKKHWQDVCSVSETENGVGIIQESSSWDGRRDIVFTKISFCPWCASQINSGRNGNVIKEFVVVEKVSTVKCEYCEQTMFTRVNSEICNICKICEEMQSIEYDKAKVYNHIQEKISNAINKYKQEYIIIYRVGISNDGTIVDNLDEVAIEGKVRFASSRRVFFEKKEEKDYRSKIVVNPTWLDIAVMANEMVKYTGSKYRCFDGVEFVIEENSIKKMMFVMS